MLRAFVEWLQEALLLLVSSRKDVKFMVAVYVALIAAGRRTADDVPAKLQAAVLEDLAALGLDGNGEPVAEEPVA